MQRLEVRGAVRPVYESLGVKRLTASWEKLHLCKYLSLVLRDLSPRNRKF